MANAVRALTETVQCDILSGASLSAEINMVGRIPVGLYIPAGWASASVTFQFAHEGGGIYFDVLDNTGAELVAPVVAGAYLALNSQLFLGARFLRLRSGTTSTPVNQVADQSVMIAAGVADVPG